MSKRSISSSTSDEYPEAKKAKLHIDHTETSVPYVHVQQKHTADGSIIAAESAKTENRDSQYAYTFLTESTALADFPIPPCEPHWGIIPRSGSQLPDVEQPPACTSDGAVEPPLWQDLKGGVRIKRGERFINGYDQAYHLHIRMMNERTKPGEQQPKREPVAYMCEHGMPDWSNCLAINVVNKGIQDQIKKNSNEEPWSKEDRGILAAIFREQPQISLLEAAKTFNDRAYPPQMQKEGAYPIGRFTESIQHEYRVYKAAYNQGQAPVLVATKDIPATKKDIPLENLYAAWSQQKKDQKDAEKAAKKAAAKKARNAAKTTQIIDEDKKKARKARSYAAKTSSGAMSDTAGVLKKRKRKGSSWDDKTPEEQAAAIARADATGDAILGQDAAEKAAQIDVGAFLTGRYHVPTLDQHLVPEDDEQLLRLAGRYDAEDTRASSPPSATAWAIVNSPSYGQRPTAHTAEHTQRADFPGSDAMTTSFGLSPVTTQPLNDVVADTETAFETEIFIQASQMEATVVEGQMVGQVAVERVVKEDIVDKTTRKVQIDENYDENEIL